MFKIGEVVVHKRDICKITDIVKNYRDGVDFYTLVSIGDASLKIHTPVINDRDALRPIMSKKEAEALINSIPDVEPVTFTTAASGNEYKALIDSGCHTDLIRAIKTAYMRQEDRRNNKQRTNENDKIYFRLAERILYSELSASLGVPYEDTKQIVADRVKALLPVEEKDEAAV